jgi:23S rRNA U2552 (ribose-2'-O)-methylase RlmE/FtsJ
MKKNIKKSFIKSPLYSSKFDKYFTIYENLFQKYINKRITFVEVGVAMGGSLFMWRDYLGKKANIIGIDLNPEAKKLRKFGFNIVIGDQSDKNFWKEFYFKIGKVDVLLDDGGHTNIQQICTLANSVNNINDGGMIVIEDTQTSYIKKGFNNPSSSSFINYSKYAIDAIHRRSPMLDIKHNNYSNKVYSIHYYESLVAFNIDSSKCNKNKIVINKNVESYYSDYRHKSYFVKIRNIIKKKFPNLLNFSIMVYLVKKISGRNLFYFFNKIKILSYFSSIKK